MLMSENGPSGFRWIRFVSVSSIRANRRSAEVLASAEAQATEIRGKGEADAAQYLTVFQQNPELANFIFRLTALESALKERSTLVLDQSTQPFDLFQGSFTNLLKK